MKSNIKKTIAFALTLCTASAGIIAPNAEKLALSPVPVIADAAETQGDFEYDRISVNCAAITKYNGSASYLTLPDSVTINGSKLEITEIGAGAFAENAGLRSVTIPEGYTDIDKEAFYYCRNLSTVSLPSSLEEIDYKAFSSTGITGVTIPKNVYKVDSYAFSGCTALKTVTINTRELEEFGEGAFASCSSLTSISLPSGLKKISHGLFSCCSSLTSVSIPSTVTTIEGVAFGECTNLSNITLPSSVTNVEFNAFQNTKWISSQQKIYGMVIINNNIVDTSSASGIISIPNGISIIPKSAFVNNTGITKVYIPDSVSEIGDEAFSGCIRLNEVSVPDSVKVIGIGSFSDCSSLKTIYLPASLETIKERAFSNCTSLENIIGARHMNYEIAGDAFDGCLNLRKINNYTVASRNGGSINFYASPFVKKYFAKTDRIGFIQDYVDICCSIMADYVKAVAPNFNDIQTAYALELLIRNMCRSPMIVWDSTHPGEARPYDLESWEEFHRESSVFLNGIAVCEGYAKGYYRALEKAGIESEIATSGTHNWNMLKIDGIWFNSDIYWNDNQNTSAWSFCTDQELLNLEVRNKTSRSHTKTGTLVKKGTAYFPDYVTDDTSIRRCVYPLGDVNLDQKVTSSDAELLRRYVQENYRPGTFSKVCADMNADGVLNAYDYYAIMRKANS